MYLALMYEVPCSAARGRGHLRSSYRVEVPVPAARGKGCTLHSCIGVEVPVPAARGGGGGATWHWAPVSE
jgi:hypothetical protein